MVLQTHSSSLFIIAIALSEFKEMLQNQDKSANSKRQEFAQTNHKQRLSAPDLENTLLSPPVESKKPNKKDKTFMMTIASSKPKIRKALRNLIPRNLSNSSVHR